jgi:hypothetical protein
MRAAQAKLSASRVARRSVGRGALQAGCLYAEELALGLQEFNMNTTLSPHDIHRLLHAEHDDPFGVLGLHQIDQVWVVRSLRPDAKELVSTVTTSSGASPRSASQRKVYSKLNRRAYQKPLNIWLSSRRAGPASQFPIQERADIL